MKNYECYTYVDKRFSNFREYARYIVSHSVVLGTRVPYEPETVVQKPHLFLVPSPEEYVTTKEPLFYMSPIGMVLQGDFDAMYEGMHERISVARY